MPEFPFEDAKGKRVYVEYDTLAEAPKVGAWIKLGRKRLKRVASTPAIQVRSYEHTAWSLPPNLPGAPAYTSDGFAKFRTKADCDRFQKLNPRYKLNK